MEGRYFPITCGGGSMEPTIPEGTRLVVDTHAPAIRPGDVICFADGEDGSWTVHRVLATFRLRGERFYAQGPESARGATVVAEARIKGVVQPAPAPTAPADYYRGLTFVERLAGARAAARFVLGRAGYAAVARFSRLRAAWTRSRRRGVEKRSRRVR